MNPQAAEKKVAEANQKYFSNMAEFLKVKKETTKMWSHSRTGIVIVYTGDTVDTGGVDFLSFI